MSVQSIVGSSKCSVKPLFYLNDQHQCYHQLKLSFKVIDTKDLLEYIQSETISSCKSIKIFHPSLNYSKFQTIRRIEGIGTVLFHKNMAHVDARILNYGGINWLKKNHRLNPKIIWNNIINMHDFFIDNLMLAFRGHLFSTNNRPSL